VTGWPSVGVVLPTHDRPGPLRTALAAVLAQDYPGQVSAVVVYDRAEPDLGLADGDRVRVAVNARTPGLAGARNTGIGLLDTDLVAFCDDDDEWLPGKLLAQVEALLARPGAEFATCGITVENAGTVHPRLAGRDEVTHADLVRSRSADRRHRPGRRDHPGQPERGLGSGAARRAPPSAGQRRPAAGPGGVGRLFSLRAGVADQG